MTMEHALIATLVFVVIIVLLVFAALYIIDRCLPADMKMPAKLVVGVLALIAILVRLVPGF
jgi:hypothetical protein